jgi:hypothetical protein
LCPAFCSAADNPYDVLGLRKLDVERGQTAFRSFAAAGHVELADSPGDSTTPSALGFCSARQCAAAWLGRDLAQQTFGSFESKDIVSAQPAVRRLLDGDSWTRIQELALPKAHEDLIFIGPYRLKERLHNGHLASLHVAELTGAPTNRSEHEAAPAAEPLVHILKRDSARDPVQRAAFLQRIAHWLAVNHDCVPPILDHGNSDGDAGLPYFATTLLRHVETVNKRLERESQLSPDVMTSVITAAAEVCHAANRAGISLLALPQRHFLVDEEAQVWFTGFDNAWSQQTSIPEGMRLREYLCRVSQDVGQIDPAVVDRGYSPGPIADVYALGRLLAELHHRDFQSLALMRCDELDAWECLILHSLHPDVHQRFQSPGHILTYLREWAPRFREPTPLIVDVPTGPVVCSDGRARPQTVVPRFSISKYPVTNLEYARFCRFCQHSGRARSLPLHLRIADGRKNPHQRLSGPLFPVTYVSLADAQAYCEWLREETGGAWRLPTEAEWMRAATLDLKQRFPWGDDDPSSNRANASRAHRGPTVVGAFPDGASACGCLDMAGNVWEWCTDFLLEAPPRRVLKGGAYDFAVDKLSVQARDAAVAARASPHLGFRVVCAEGHL